jgi:hypothetical protein
MAFSTVGTIFRDLVRGLDEDPTRWEDPPAWDDPNAWLYHPASEDPDGRVDIDGWGGPYNLIVLTIPWNCKFN